MAVSAGAPRPTIAAAFPPIPLRRRLLGFGSIYGKTIRDSRPAFIVAAGLLGGLALVMGAAIGTVFPTPAARLEVDQLIGSMPASMVNLFGNATLMGPKLGTLGGYMSWKYGAMFALGTALWSILALSGTLAGEAARGSLDLVAASPFGKRRIALEKLAAHLTVLWLAMAFIAIMTFVSSNAFGDTALGDQISLGSSIGFALWAGLIAMCFGGLALALAPLLGRAGSAAVAGIVMIVLWTASGLDIGGPLVTLNPFHWTVNHVPLAGFYDWTGLAAVGVVAVIFLAIGVDLFRRRDLGVTAGLSFPSLPKDVLGVRGPVARAFGDQLPRALAWGLGMGLRAPSWRPSSARSPTRWRATRTSSRRSRRSSPATTSRPPAAGSSCTSRSSTSPPASPPRRSSRNGRRTRRTVASRRSSRVRCRAPAGCLPAGWGRSPPS